ncbi:MAG TPA: hypothetical protein VF692_07765, partial [Pyrinomonadaceae bacterium]
ENVLNGFCEDCPVKEFERALEAEAVETLEERCQGKWQKYGLQNFQRAVLDVINLEETDKRKWTVKTGVLLNILQSERNRKRRVWEWNNRPKT